MLTNIAMIFERAFGRHRNARSSIPASAGSNGGARKGRRFEVVFDPSDMYQVWDNAMDSPVIVVGDVFAHREWREAARLACVLNSRHDTEEPPLVISGLSDAAARRRA